MFQTHKKPESGYRARAVALFGLSEIARGAACSSLLKSRDYRLLGRLMCISHDGDRIVKHDGRGALAWDNEVSRVEDEYLLGLIAGCRSENDGSPEGAVPESAGLMFQPGGYRCSSEELDLLVDTACRVPGVLGAGLTGAGFGGCVLVLVENSQVSRLFSQLQESYYQPKGLPLGAEVCNSVAGAGAV
jgi:galactokinase